MSNILIAHHDPEYTREVAAALESAGYQATVCTSAWESELTCLRGLLGSCPLTDGADLMIYDPGLTDARIREASGIAALASAEDNPVVPLLLAPCGHADERGADSIVRDLPTAKIAMDGPAAVVAQVASLIGPASGAKWAVEAEIGRD